MFSFWQIVLSGNIEDVFHTKKMVLEFHLFREENYRVFNVCAIDKHSKAEGRIKIQLTSYKSTVETVGGEHADCFVCGSRKRQQTRVTKHKHITNKSNQAQTYNKQE